MLIIALTINQHEQRPMFPQKLAQRNLENEVSKLAAREITLTDGSTASFKEALEAAALFFTEPYKKFFGHNISPYHQITGVYAASSAFNIIAEHDLSKAPKVYLRALQYLDEDLAYLAKLNISEEDRNKGLESSLATAQDIYGNSFETAEDKKFLNDWLNVLKSPENFESAVKGILTELDRSKLIHHAQNAYKSLPSKSTPTL